MLDNPIISAFKRQLTDGETLFDFHGEVNEAEIGRILEKVEQQLESSEEDFKKQRKVYNILVEALQNVFHHTSTFSAGDESNGFNLKNASFILGRKNGEYNILAANYIEMQNIAPLKAKLDKINSLDKDGLRDFYKEVLDNGQYSVHGGGGLGIIDIARKSGNQLEYHFAAEKNDLGIYILKIKV